MSGRTVSVKDLQTDIIGIDVLGNGSLNLDRFNRKLPLAALADDVLTYINAHGGGTDVADAVVYFGTNPDNIAGGANSNVVNPTVTGFKLRGFYIYGDGDATVTLTFTPSGSSAKTLKFKIHQIERNGLFNFPNPIVCADSSSVTLNITNDTAGAVGYYSMITGEAI